MSSEEKANEISTMITAQSASSLASRTDSPTQELGGNIGTPSSTDRSRCWSFTLNNPSESEMTHLHKMMKLAAKHVYQLETGENGTPHVQGAVVFKSQRSFNSVKKWMGTERVYISRTRSKRGSAIYCCKKEGRLDGPWIKGYTEEQLTKTKTCMPKKQLEQKIQADFNESVRAKVMERYEKITWKKWQQEIVDLVDQEPHERKIYWYWEKDGNVGKSFLCKYLCLTKICVMSSGKKHDIFHQVFTMMNPEEPINTKPKLPEVVIVDMPRSAEKYILYGVLEELKNGMIFSGKYQGGQCIFPPPHVIVFANTPPNINSMSADRWHVVNLNPIDAIAEFSKLC